MAGVGRGGDPGMQAGIKPGIGSLRQRLDASKGFAQLGCG